MIPSSRRGAPSKTWTVSAAGVKFRGWPGFTVLFLLVGIVPATVATAHASAANRPQAVLAPGNYSFSIKPGWRSRSYLVHVPAHAPSGAPLPLVLNFHGSSSTGKAQEDYTRMDETADRYGFIVVYPDGTGPPNNHLTWNAGGCCPSAMLLRVDDVGFVRSLIDDLAARTPIDRARIYATGFSNGAMLAYRLAAEASDRIAAIAAVEGSMVTADFHPSRPVSIMHIHSIDDQRVPYHGGYRGYLRIMQSIERLINPDLGNPDVEQMLARWRKFDKCPAQPRIGPTLRGEPGSPDYGNTATKYTWGPGEQGTEVVLWKLSGSQHVWPGGEEKIHLQRPTNLFNANEEMWEFFKKFALPLS